MNVYDFDDTIYDGDSSIDFLRFEAKRHPLAFLKASAGAILPTISYLFKIGTKENMKEHVFSIVKAVPNMDKEMEIFWSSHQNRFKGWYLEQKQKDDVIISASPFFLVKAGCDCIGVTNVIATEMDEKTGRITGFNCKGENKPGRFKEKFPDAVIEKFYSDSKSDQPMVDLAQEGYLVKGNQVKEW